MIRRLSLTNWRAYDRLDLTFEEGVTFLVAANGVGKSSIVMGAAWGLLGEASNVDAASCVRGDADHASVQLEVELPDGKRLEIERSVTARGRTQSEILLDGEPVTDLQAILQEEFAIDPAILGRLAFMTDGSHVASGREFQLRDHLFRVFGVSALLDPLHDIDQMMLLLRWSGRRAEDIVLEITEREAVRDVSRLETVVAAYRAEGFRFALDDVGEGHSTFELLAAAAPEFIKISSRLVRRHHVPAARSVIRGIVAFAAASGSEPIAEGIEGNEELEAMAELGVCLGQGYALGRPVNAADLPAELLAPLNWRLSLRSVAGHLSSSLSA